MKPPTVSVDVDEKTGLATIKVVTETRRTITEMRAYASGWTEFTTKRDGNVTYKNVVAGIELPNELLDAKIEGVSGGD